MAKIVEHKYELTGAHKGKNMKIGPHSFVQGFFSIMLQPDKAEGLTNYFSHFNAWLVGSPEHKAAKERDNGSSENLDGGGSNASGVLPNGAGTAEGSAGTGNAGTEGNAPGLEATGSDGASDGGIAEDGSVTLTPEALKIADAVRKLDVMNDEHWTQAGLPSVAVVAENSGIATATRKDIEAASPGWTREKALEAAI